MDFVSCMGHVITVLLIPDLQACQLAGVPLSVSGKGASLAGAEPKRPRQLRQQFSEIPL